MQKRVNGIFPGQDGNPLGGWGIGTVEAWVLAALLYFERARRGAADVRERAAGQAKRPLPLARGFKLQMRLGLAAGVGLAIHRAVAHDEVDGRWRQMSSSGFPGMATMSAQAPGFSTPMSSRASSSAATEVPARSARIGLSPALTIAWNSRMPWLNGNMPQSVPKANLTSLEATSRWASRIAGCRG